MISKVQIFNMALARIGVSQFVQSVDERSNEANVCRLFFDAVVEFALRDADWNCARRYTPLALAAGDIPTGVLWRYMYAYPSDCLMARAVLPPTVRIPRADQRIPFEVANVLSGGNDIKVIFTDKAEAVLRYTKNITNITLFDPIFVSGIAYLLGSEVATPLSVKPDVATAARQGYVQVISRAGAVDLQEAQDGPLPEPEAIAERNS